MVQENKEEINKLHEEIDKIEKSYPITVSDWINILHEKTSRSFQLELYVFVGVITAIIGVPALVEYTGYSGMGFEWFKTITVLMIIFGLFVIYEIISRKNRSINEPYEKLLKKIIGGEITESREILKEYNKI